MEPHQKVSLIIFFVIIGGLIVFQYIRVIRNYYRVQKKDKVAEFLHRQRFAKATPARASTRTIQATGVSRIGSGMIKVKLELEVSGNGFQHSIMDATWIVRWLDYYRCTPGNSFPVRIDAEDKKLVYPDVTWAMYDYTQEEIIG